jgi:hypothetical protein
MHSVSGAVDLFLAVKREMIAVLGNGHGSDEARGSNACSLKRGRQWSDYRRLSVVAAANVFRTHRAATQESGWLVVEMLADFLADAAPLVWGGLYFVRLDNRLDYRKVLGKARAAGGRWLRSAATGGRGLPRISAGGGVARGGQ